MTEWLYERGIGEERAALIANGRVVAGRIARNGDVHVGDVLAVRLGADRIVTGADGFTALLDGPAPGVTEGAALSVVVVREAMPEARAQKRARVRLTDAAPHRTTLAERIAGEGGRVVAVTPHGPDRLEAAGWTEVLEAAATGTLAFDGGALHIVRTPAMTLVDVDGWLAPDALALAAARAVGDAIRLFDLGGSIGIDFPTLDGKAARAAVDAALAAAIPLPAERTAMNGFGFVQIVRPRSRVSLLEAIQRDPVTAAAMALLRRAERSGVIGPSVLRAAPAVIAQIARIDRAPLERALGGSVRLDADAALGTDQGHIAPA